MGGSKETRFTFNPMPGILQYSNYFSCAEGAHSELSFRVGELLLRAKFYRKQYVVNYSELSICRIGVLSDIYLVLIFYSL